MADIFINVTFIFYIVLNILFQIDFFFVKLFYLRSMEHYHKLRAPKSMYDFNSDKLKSENILKVDV